MRPLWLGVVILAAGRLEAQTVDGAEGRQTAGYLRGLQAADGGFLPGLAEGTVSGARAAVPPHSSLRATLAALRALRAFGGEVRDPAGCLQFVEGCRDRGRGGFADHPDAAPDAVSTALGIMVLVELKQPVDDRAWRYLGEHARRHEEIRLAAAALESAGRRVPQADAWLRQVLADRRADGTFGPDAVRDTASGVVTVLRLGGTVAGREHVLAVLRGGQRPDGGFGREGRTGSDLESCYRVLRAFAMLKEKPADVAACRRFVRRCRNADGGYGVTPDQPSTAAATYFAGMVLRWLGE